MGRYLPAECHHGTTLDWGDFGDCQDGCEAEGHDPDECPDILPPCEQCEFERAAGGAEFVQALHEQLDNDIRIDIGEMRLADRGLYEEEREAIVQSVLRVLSAPPSPAGIEANQGDE